jgi:predicted enzyme related to lactoylglutathione lyase
MPVPDSFSDGVAVWLDLSSSDPAAAATFYGSLFGWVNNEMDERYGGYSQFTYNGKRVAGLGPKPDADMPDFWCTYFQTSDIHASVKQVTASGGTVFVEPMEVPEQGTMAIVMDAGSNAEGHNPHGAVFGLWQPGEHTGFELHMEASAATYFELQSTGYAQAVQFYGDVLGNPVISLSDTDEFRYSQLSLPGTNPGEGYAGIMDASAYLPPEVPSHWGIYIGADDVDATVGKAVELGGSVVAEPMDTPYGRLATIGDPFGAMIKLQQVP